jgi:hypothetical protein
MSLWPSYPCFMHVLMSLLVMIVDDLHHCRVLVQCSGGWWSSRQFEASQHDKQRLWLSNWCAHSAFLQNNWRAECRSCHFPVRLVDRYRNDLHFNGVVTVTPVNAARSTRLSGGTIAFACACLEDSVTHRPVAGKQEHNLAAVIHGSLVACTVVTYLWVRVWQVM